MRRGCGRAHEVAQQLQGRAVGPVQVVEHEQQRRAARDLGEQRGERVEQALALHARVAADAGSARLARAPAAGRRGRPRAGRAAARGTVSAAPPDQPRSICEDRPVGAGAGLVEAAVEDDGAVARARRG